MNPLQNASTFLITSLFDLYLLVLILRLILQYLRVDYYNPLTQFIVKATSPLVVPIRRIIPGYFGIDFATVAVIVIVTLVKFSLLSLVSIHKLPTPLAFVLLTFGSLIALTINLFFYAILLSVILSWVAPMSRSPVTSILYNLTEPLMRPVRRIIPTIGGFDLTPIPVLIGLQLLNILIADPLVQMGLMALR